MKMKMKTKNRSHLDRPRHDKNIVNVKSVSG